MTHKIHYVDIGERAYEYFYVRGNKEITSFLKTQNINAKRHDRPKPVGIDIETYPKKKYKDEHDGGLLCRKSKIRTLQIYDKNLGGTVILDFMDEDGSYLLANEQIAKLLNYYLRKSKLVAHNAIFETSHLQNVFLAHGINKRLNITCTQTSYLMVVHATMLAPKRFTGSLKEVAKRVLGIELAKEEQRSDWSIPALTQEQLDYAARDAIIPVLIWHKLKKNIKALGMDEICKLTMMTQEPIAHINIHGLPIDVKKHRKLTKQWKAGMEEYEQKCFYLLNEGKGQISHDELKELLIAKITKKFKSKMWEASAFVNGRPRLDTFTAEREKFMDAAREIEAKIAPALAAHKASGIPNRELSPKLKAKRQLAVACKRFSRNIDDYLVDANSAKQVSDWLRKHVDAETIAEWPVSEKSGQLKTDAETLGDHDYIEVIKPLAQFKKFAKLYGTYGKGWKKYLVKHSKHTLVHPNLACGRLETGRMSSYSPNVQNLPRDKDIRKLFVARNDNYRLLVADFNQIELRVLAYISNDDVMQKVYENGGDLHSSTALLSGKTQDQVTEEEWKLIRQSAKSINFAKIFGAGCQTIQAYAKKVYKVLKPIEYFEEFSQRFDEMYSGAYEWRRRHSAECKRTLSVSTPLGKVRRLDPDTYYTVGLNHPIQGGACEILMLSANYIHNAFIKSKINAQFSNIIHDELCIHSHVDNIDEAAIYIKEGMEWGLLQVFPNATLTNLVDVRSGSNWADAKG